MDALPEAESMSPLQKKTLRLLLNHRGERLQSKSPGIMNRLDLYKEVQAAGFPVQTTSITEYKDSRIKGEIQYQCERINYLLSEVLMIPS